ncbi:MAG: DUF1801 domain-containing protein [Bacteroidia bacterium]
MKFKTVDEYFEHAPAHSLDYLNQMRKLLKETLPEAKEVISYNMPAYRTRQVLVYFAWNKDHIGYYPTPSGVTNFQERVNKYKHSKAAIQFPFDEPLPVDLIRDIAKFRQEEVREKKGS